PPASLVAKRRPYGRRRPEKPMVRDCRSSLSLGLEYRAGERIFGAPSRPYDELKGLVIPFASLEGRLQKRFALPLRRLRAIQHEALAVEKQPFRRPDVEMAEPKLFIDLNEQPVH